MNPDLRSRSAAESLESLKVPRQERTKTWVANTPVERLSIRGAPTSYWKRELSVGKRLIMANGGARGQIPEPGALIGFHADQEAPRFPVM